MEYISCNASIGIPDNKDRTPVIYSDHTLYELLVNNPDGVIIEATCVSPILIKPCLKEAT